MPQEEKILISLLDGPKTGTEIVLFVAPEQFARATDKLGNESRALVSVLSNWYRKNSKTGYLYNLENGERKFISKYQYHLILTLKSDRER